MSLSKIALLAGAASVSALVAHSAANSAHAVDIASECRLPPVIDPSKDGLPHSSKLWEGKAALERQIVRHQAIVRVPSICYDDLGAIGEDKRWAPFDELHKVIENTYPTIYKTAKVEKINTYGLLYTIQGSEPSLKPTVLMAHQDVVPVADESTWTHPPFSGHYDGTFLWGRGASDDKNSLTGIMSALEEMLGETNFKPRRTILLAFGFDEECSGYRGAKHIAAEVTKRYGDDGVAVILDEGGAGVLTVGNVKYVLPSITEKGHVDVWFELDVVGGHSSVPFPHTGIGIISEIVKKLEENPYAPILTKDSPVYAHMACLARHSPDEMPEVTERVRKGDAQGVAEVLNSAGLFESFLVRTSQAVDMISGGQKINAMPEKTTLGVNYRVTLDDGIPKVLNNIVSYVQPIADKYNLTLEAFKGDDNYRPVKATAGRGRYDVDWQGKLTIKTNEVSQPAPVSPMDNKVWETFSGTAQYTFGFGGTVVPVGETMTGNTDTRHYQNLTPNIYRFTPASPTSGYGIHTIDERINMHEHMTLVAFYYDFIRNFDAATVDGESSAAENLEL